jgi:hypothetical protein
MGRAFGANGKSKSKGHARAKAPFFLVGVYRGLKPAAPPVRQVQVQVQKQRQPQKQIPCGNDRKKGKNGSALPCEKWVLHCAGFGRWSDGVGGYRSCWAVGLRR